MNRRSFLKAIASAALLPILPRRLYAATSFRRRRPSDPAWPSKAAWKRLHDAVGGNLLPVNFPPLLFKTDPDGAAAVRFARDLRNPYYIGDQPGLTQTSGWLDAWATRPSVYAVAARNVADIAAAVNFARENNLRLIVRGGGHSYQGTSNAPDSLMIWTRHLNDIALHDRFVPQGCEHTQPPQPAVTLGAGAIWKQAYEAVTTAAGRYVQGGGCLTVGVAGLIQSGGFGSFSKHYGLAAGGLLEAEVVTADGQVRIANARTNPDLFWALKGGGGGTYGVVSRLTLRLHDLPEFFGAATFTIKAPSDDAYRRLLREFIGFYRDHLFNDHWGEQVHVTPDNSLGISMVSQGLDAAQSKAVWRPFLEWAKRAPDAYSVKWPVAIATWPARRMWDVQWMKENWPQLPFPSNGNPLIALFDDLLAWVPWQPLFDFDNRPGAAPDNVWWKGDAGQVGWFIWGFESLWLPASLLTDSAQQRLADALFAASRYSTIELHFNKGLAGAPPDALAASADTAINPAALTAFALAIAANAQQPAFPGIPGHEPSLASGRDAAARIDRAMTLLRALVPNPGSYVSESNYFEPQWRQSYWGDNHSRLAQIKAKYDPDGLFVVHNGIGSDQWTPDGFTRL